MTFVTSTTVDVGRALMAALQPLTGSRSSGTVRMRATAGNTLSIPMNSYWVPIIDGQRQTSWLFKAARGTNEDGSWPVDDSGTSVVNLISNIGGQRHNLASGTVFAPVLPQDLLATGADAPTATSDFEGASEPGNYCGVRDMVLYETFDGPDFSVDLHRSPIRQFPAVMLAFQNLEPADGVAIAQNNQGEVNAGNGKKFYKVTYTISVITSRAEGDMSRRMEGMLIADTIVSLLMDKHATDTGECLSNPGGLQVRQMIREDGPQPVYKKFYIYTVLVSAMTVVTRLDFRVFPPWLRAVMNVDKPQVPSLPGQGTFRLVSNNVLDMTPGTMDLTLDGTFARAGSARVWRPATVANGAGALLSFAADERRLIDFANGVYLEPVVTNELAAVATDFTAWTASGAAVTADTEDAPDATATADQVAFTAGGAGFVSTPVTLPDAVPVVLQVFAKAVGQVGKTSMRLAVEDAATVLAVSEDIEVSNVWKLYRFEVTATLAGAGTFRVMNASDDAARTVVLWGAMFDDTNRHGPQYTSGTKLIETLTFNPVGTPAVDENLITPAALLTGSWRLRWRAPLSVPSDVLGSALGDPDRVLVSVGNGVTELFTIKLFGTPGSGGELVVETRTGGTVISISALEWAPGAELWFGVDATGQFEIKGTLNGDGIYPFDRYDVDADVGDFLSIGHLSTGALEPVAGWYIAVDTGVTLGLDTDQPSAPLSYLGCNLIYVGSILS